MNSLNAIMLTLPFLIKLSLSEQRTFTIHLFHFFLATNYNIRRRYVGRRRVLVTCFHSVVAALRVQWPSQFNVLKIIAESKFEVKRRIEIQLALTLVTPHTSSESFHWIHDAHLLTLNQRRILFALTFRLFAHVACAKDNKERDE